MSTTSYSVSPADVLADRPPGRAPVGQAGDVELVGALDVLPRREANAKLIAADGVRDRRRHRQLLEHFQADHVLAQFAPLLGVVLEA